MAVSDDDVRHVAALARLGSSRADVPSLVHELNGILEHMEVLARVETAGVQIADRRECATDCRRRDDDAADAAAARAPLESIRAADARRVLPRAAARDARGAGGS